MTIAYFVNYYPVRNQPVFEDEARALLQRGHEVVIVPVWGALAEVSKVPEALRARIAPVPAPYALLTLLLNMLAALQAPLRYLAFTRTARQDIGVAQTMSTIALARSLGRRRVDRIHAHFASTGALRGLLTAEWLNVPYSCTGHGTDILIRRAPFLPRLLARSKPFITISEYNRRRLLAEVKEAKEADIVVVRCGVDPAYFHRDETTCSTSGVPTLLSVSWFRPVKGLEYLVEACARLRRRGHAFRCVIVGGGVHREDIERRIRACHLQEHFTLTGPLDRPHVLDWYRSVDIFVLPSLSEGIPVSLMEAMAMRLPVVATRITGIPELITDGEDGLLVEPGDARALSGAIEALITHPERRRLLGRHARGKIERDYDLGKSVDHLVRVFSTASSP